MMQKTEDLRIVRTKKALGKAFYSLLAEKNFEDITINELCEKADVRRATFYKHFTDKYDFLTYMIKKLREEFGRTIWNNSHPEITKEYYLEYARAMITFLTNHSAAVDRILSSDMCPTIINIMTRQNYIDTKERLYKSVAEGMTLPASPESCANMLTGGICHIIVNWFSDENHISKEQLTEDILSLVDCILCRAK